MKTIDELIAEIPKGWGFLLRDAGEDGKPAFMAHVMDESFDYGDEGSFAIWDDSLNVALETAIAQAKLANGLMD